MTCQSLRFAEPKALSPLTPLYNHISQADSRGAVMELLEEQKIAYEVLPEAPNFPHFKECPKRVAASAGNDWLYHQFDREREGLI